MEPSTTILAIEDDSGDVELLRRYLGDRPDLKLEFADRLSTGLKLISESRIDLVLLDLGLPDSQGIETLTKLRSQAPDVPVVVLTGLTEEALGIAAVRMGAQDYLVKGHTNRTSLSRSIHYAMERHVTQKALRKSQTLLREAQRVAHMGHWELDTQMGTPRWSEEIFHIFGLDFAQGEPSFPALRNIIHQEDWELLHKSVTEACNHGTSFNIQFRVIHPDESIRWVEAKGDPTGNADGGTFRVFGTVQDITDRKRGEDSVEAERQRFFSLLDAMPAYLCLMTPDYHVVFINRYFRERFGDPEGRRCYEFAFGLSGPCENCQALIVLETKTPNEYEWLGPNGQTYLVCDQLVHDIDGSPLILEMGIDVTERKRAEEAILASEEKYRTLFEESFDGLFIASPGGKILDMNKKGVAMFGYDTKEEILRLDLERDVYAHLPNQKRILSMVNEQGTAEYEVVVKKKSGEEIITHCALTAVKDETGVITSYRGIIRDITELVQTQARLENERARLRTLVQTIPDLVWLKDADGVYLTCNPRFERFFGAKESDIVGKTDYDFVDADLADFFRDHDRKAMDAGKASINEEWITFADDGHRELLETIKTPMYESDGSLIGVLGIGRNITAAREAEEALQAASVYNRSLIEASLDPLVTISAEGKITDVNAATERVTGYSRHELIGTDFADYFTDPQKARAGYQRAFTEGMVKDYELQIRHRDGDLTPVIYNASVYHDRSGEIVGVFAAARDITERKISEELIQIRLNLLEFAASHPLGELLQKTLDEIGSLTHSPIGFYHFVESDQKTLSLQAWSTRTVKEFCKVEGKEQHHRIDQAGVWADCLREREPVIHNDYSSLSHRKGMPEGHAAVIRELVVPTIKSGQIVAVLGIGNKPTDYTEKDIEIVSYLADVAWEIAKRKQAEESLKESEKQYRTLFEESIDGVYSALRDGTLTDANPAFCELFDYTRDEMIGKDISQLYLDPADRPKFQKKIEKTGFVKDYEIKFKKRDGTEVDCLISSSVIFEEDGSITGYRGIVRDLTARKALQRQLQQAQKMEAIGTLAGGIAHDFNNLLQVVLGYSELVLADSALPDSFRDDLGKALLAGRNGADLVQRLLTFSRKAEAKPLDLNLNQRVQQTQKFLERTIPKMINIELILGDGLARIHADPTQMDQVLMNLSVNARDAMPEGGKLVIETANVVIDEDYARSHLEAEPGRYVVLRVSDTGSGMGKETLEHIFEPFFTTKGPGQGTGLGLAMVFGIVKQHQGFINCYSEVGHGTTFRIYLPAIEMEIDPDVAITGIMPAFGTETILLADDEEFVRDLGKRILERSGYTVLTAANGKEALDLYKRGTGKISLVVLDLIMPEMGGMQCLGELLKIDPKARVLIASGLAASGETKEALETGARGFVDKPYNMKEMLQSVREVLDAD